MNTQTIKSQLQALRMTTAANELEDMLASSKRAVNLEWLADLLQREIDQRRENNLRARIKAGKFPEETSLETFDYEYNPLEKDKILELASLSFVQKRQIALFLGPPGTGKTHVAIALGLLAIQAGKKVYCSSAKRLARDIQVHKARNALDVLFKKILGSHLWILDDFGVVSMQKDVAEEVFDLMDRRKQTTAMILTSNRDVSEWDQVFPDLIIANATVDRMFDRAKTVIFQGNSYRLKDRLDF
jgi:DNA replication protein DnaC